MTDNELDMIMESLVERYNNGEITYAEASKVEDKVRANYAKDKAAKRAAKQQKLENRVNAAVGKKILKQSTKYANKYNKLENKKNEIYTKAAKLNAQKQKDPSSITDREYQKMISLANNYKRLNDKESNTMAASQKYSDKVKQRGENRKLRGSMGTKNYLASKANQAKNKLFKAHEGAMDDYDMTRLEVFEAYENGIINEAEKYNLLNTLESTGEFGDYPTEESVKLDIFDAYESGEITEADKYELLAMIED